MNRNRPLLRKPYFYLLLFAAAFLVYVPISEAYALRKFVEETNYDPQFEPIVDIEGSLLYRLNEDIGSPNPNLSATCDEKRLRHGLLEHEYWIGLRYIELYSVKKSLTVYQKDKPLERLRYAAMHLFGREGERVSLEEYYDRRGEAEEVSAWFYKFLISSNCLEPTHTLAFTGQAGTEQPTTQDRQRITLTNDNPLYMPEAYAPYVTTPVYYELYALPTWLTANYERGVLLTGEQEIIELAATCPVGVGPKTYEAKVAIFQVPSFPELVEMRLECA